MFFFNKNSTPLVKTVTALSLFFIIFDKFNFISPTSIPLFDKFLALWNSSDKFNKLFDGIQPMFKQVPPREPLDSMHAVFRPNCESLIAHT